jgi:hypothetical protein
LRREGIEGYIADFNDMVKKVQGVVGRAEIEVLPVVPIVREGLDRLGRELISMVREWVEWIGVVSGRESVMRLSGTSGREFEKEGEEKVFMWKPSFHMKTKDVRTGSLGALRLIEGGRMETVVRAACGSGELEKMQARKGGDGEKDGGESMKRTRCERNGVSMEGEFVFTKAVGEFLREEVRNGTFKGNYMLNLKEQMRMRWMRQCGVDKRLRVLLVGASQVKRIGDDMVRMHGEKMRLVGCVRWDDEHTVEGHTAILDEVMTLREEVDVVVIGGPTNSLMKHGKESARGFGGERQVRVCRKRDGVDEWTVTYHMTDPVRITMSEKMVLVEKMVELLTEIKGTVGEGVKVVHLTMFPRFVEQCCKDHMTDEDVWLLDGIRRDVNREIKDGLTESGKSVEVVDWWTVIGARNELTISEMRKSGIVCGDNVHLTTSVNRSAADFLMLRVFERRPREEAKRRRLN